MYGTLFFQVQMSFIASGCAVCVLRMNLVYHPGLDTLEFKDPQCSIQLMFLIFKNTKLSGSLVNQKTEVL